METFIQEEYNDQGKELREHGTTAFPVACYGGDWQEISVPLHWHAEMEVGFVVKGQVLMHAGKEQIVLEEGDGFFVNAGIPHAFSRGEKDHSTQRSLVFDPSIVGGRIDSIFWQRYVQPILGAASMPWYVLKQDGDWKDRARDAVIHAWEACDREDADFELEVRGALTRLLCQLERHRPPEEPAKARHILRDNERIRMMMNYVQQHYAEDLTTAQIAGSAMISISECLRCFHNTIGMTPIAYLKRYRIRQAVEALADPRKKISQIAIECGFQEMSYFAKAFREIMGVTPSQYRKNREKTI